MHEKFGKNIKSDIFLVMIRVQNRKFVISLYLFISDGQLQTQGMLLLSCTPPASSQGMVTLDSDARKSPNQLVSFDVGYMSGPLNFIAHNLKYISSFSVKLRNSS